MIGAGAFVASAASWATSTRASCPARRLRGERFDLDETETALGRARSGRAVRLGDPVTVAVDAVDAPRGRVDLPAGGRCGDGTKAGKGKRKAGVRRRRDQPPRPHKYEFVETFEAGIELLGTEVKSLREGKAQIGDAYAVIDAARSGCATLTSRPMRRRRARTTTPSGPASCSCTATRSSG